MRTRITLDLDEDGCCLQWGTDWYDERGDRAGCFVHPVEPDKATVWQALQEALDHRPPTTLRLF